MLEILLSFIISFLIGFLIGIEREHSHPEGTQAIGVRTFILFSVLGTIAATIANLPLTITISLFVFCMIVTSYFRSTQLSAKKKDIGITTEISAAIIFCLGYMIPSANLIAITISGLIFLVLVERQRLHTLAREKLKPNEIKTTTILIIFTLGILPILPNQTIDPWGLFNPRNFGILIVTIAAIQFSGYVFIRLFGEQFGIAITGFLGGLISSTAVFANLSHSIETHPKFTRAIIASAVLAVMAMLAEMIIIILVASPKLLFFIITPLLVMMAVSIFFIVILLYYQKQNNHYPSSTFKNPLNLLSILRIAIFIGTTLILITIAQKFIGDKAIVLISFLGGLFEVHGISLATALLYLDNHLTLETARFALYAALLASFVSKFFLLWTLTPIRFALQTSIILLGIMLSGGLTYWVMSGF